MTMETSSRHFFEKLKTDRTMRQIVLALKHVRLMIFDIPMVKFTSAVAADNN